MSMFCYQCEQTAKGQGCTVKGVCGKEPEVSNRMDVIIEVAKGLGEAAHAATQKGIPTDKAGAFLAEMLFTTVTNVNFDPETLPGFVAKGQKMKEELMEAVEKTGTVDWSETARFVPAQTPDELEGQAEALRLSKKLDTLGPDVTGLQELVLYGLKGMAAYADHARILGLEDENVYKFFFEALAYLAKNPTDVAELVPMALKTGEVNLRVMEMLDQANTQTYGHPEPTQARITPVKGKAICVSGHDLKDLEALLQQTEGTGINVYTHGEMLPCLAYPELKKYPHLVGNYGGAWQDQKKEFDAFPGAILMTTNCIQKPAESYKDRIFTCGLVQWPGVTHISDRNFQPVIDAALAAPGFAEDEPEKTIPIGFARNAVLSVADKVIEAVKSGAVRHFFLVGGCDGAKPGRNYYTEFAKAVPEDCMILTLACGKYRFNKLDFGDIGGIPRLLDMGQCNDAYSAIQVALALANAFDCGVNDLPLSLILSWYEQKAVCILLTLLHLGIQDMRLGPTPPAFVGPDVFKVLVDNFGLKLIDEPEKDLAAILD